MRDAFVAQILNILSEDQKAMLLTADLGFGIFDEIVSQVPDSFLNVGVSEQNMVGVASGLALEGHAVFTYSIANFATLRCLEQIRNDACYHELNINIVCNGGGFGYGPLGMSHHATEDLSIMRALPGVVVVAPSDAWEAKQATRALYETQGVGYLRINKQGVNGRTSKPDEVFKLGKARRLREGSDISLIGCGDILSEVLEAAEKLEGIGISCRVISMHTIKPLDKDEIYTAIEETGGIITIEENNVLGGLGSAVAEVCLEYHSRPVKFKRIGLADQYSSIVGSQSYLRRHYKMNADAIVDTAKELLS